MKVCDIIKTDSRNNLQDVDIKRYLSLIWPTARKFEASQIKKSWCESGHPVYHQQLWCQPGHRVQLPRTVGDGGGGVGSSDIGGGCWREIGNPTGIKQWLLSTAAWQKRKDPAERRSLFNYWRGVGNRGHGKQLWTPPKKRSCNLFDTTHDILIRFIKRFHKMQAALTAADWNVTQTSQRHTCRTRPETYLVFICRPGWQKKGNSGVLDWAGQRKSGLNNRS